MDKFAIIRERYSYFMENTEEIDKALEIGAQKAREVAQKVLNRVRHKIGY